MYMAPIHHTLFDLHADDLQRVCPDADRVFVCPICLKVREVRHIGSGELNLGHVWPEHIRKGSKEAAQHYVLLCEPCNSAAGRTADAGMQEFEKINEQIKDGQITTAPRFQIVAAGRPDKKPINIGLFVESKGENTISFALESPRTKKQKKNNEEIMKQIVDYMKEGITLIRNPPPNLFLARAGWLTSAYLFAFYAFGYRYIFQSCLDEVRQSILLSFTKQIDSKLAFSNDKILTVAKWNEKVYNKPHIGVLMPVNPERQAYMRIDFRDTHIRMPVFWKYSAGWDGELIEEDLEREFILDGTGHQPHNELCDWENGFGAPDYCVKGKELISPSPEQSS